MSLRLAVFASGGGSNLQALIARLNYRHNTPASVVLVVSDRADAGALERARKAGIDTLVIEQVDDAAQLLAALKAANVEMIALAGYLRLVPAGVVAAYRDRIVNIHPALLPAFGGKGMYGMRVHRAVLDSGCTLTGATVHYVDERYDEGPVIAQWPVPVVHGDTPETLAARVLQVEHVLFSAGIELVANSIARGETAAHTRMRESVFVTVDHDSPGEAQMRRALGVD